MTAWSSRRDSRGARTFISYSTETIELLVPPGGHQTAWSAVEGEGLWWHGRWPRCADTLVDDDPPTAARRVATLTVVWLLDDELHGEVAEIMCEQLQDAWMLCQPDLSRPVEDRRASRHAGLLMALHAEIQQAFPTRDLAVEPPDVPALEATSWEQFLLVPHHQAANLMAAPIRDSEVSVRALSVVLVRTIWARLRGRRVVGRVDVVPRSDALQPAGTPHLVTPPASEARCEHPAM